MGLKTIKIGAREAVELACDNVAHRGEQPIAWFDCGSELDNLTLAMAAGWERRPAMRPTRSKSGTVCAIVPKKRPAAKAPPNPASTERLAIPCGSWTSLFSTTWLICAALS
jgi:hypothetical protein